MAFWKHFFSIILGRDASSPDAKANAKLVSGLSKDPRRYRRALLQAEGKGPIQEIASALAVIDGKNRPIVDLSYSGFAVLRDVGESKNERQEPGQKTEVKIQLGVSLPVEVRVVVARLSERVVAYEFAQMTADLRVAIEKFLDPKMIGLNMKSIDRNYFASGETFAVWYCGPRDTNFFLWNQQGRLEKALIQLGDLQFSVEPGGVPPRWLGSPQNQAQGVAIDPQKVPRAGVLFALDVCLQMGEVREFRDSPEKKQGLAQLVQLLEEASKLL